MRVCEEYRQVSVMAMMMMMMDPRGVAMRRLADRMTGWMTGWLSVANRPSPEHERERADLICNQEQRRGTRARAYATASTQLPLGGKATSIIHHPPPTIHEAQPVSAQGPGPIFHPLLPALPVRARVAVAFAHQAKPMTSGMHMHVRPLTRRKQDFPPARRRELGSAEQNHHCKTAQRRPSQSSRVQHASGWASHHLRLCVTWASHAPRRWTLAPGDCVLGSFLSQGLAGRVGRRAREVIDGRGDKKALPGGYDDGWGRRGWGPRCWMREFAFGNFVVTAG